MQASPKRKGDRWQFGGGIRMCEASTDGASVSNCHVSDKRHRLMEQRRDAAHNWTALDIALPGQSTDRKLARLFPDVRELADVIDVDNDRGPRETEVHGWNQALPSGERLGLIAVFGHEVEGFVQRSGPIVLKGSGFHGTVSLRLVISGLVICESLVIVRIVIGDLLVIF
jgi:hypothetical protein